MQENIFNKEMKIKRSALVLMILALIGSMIANGVLINDKPDIVISKDEANKTEDVIKQNASVPGEPSGEVEPVEEIKVYVTGEVNNPGVVVLKKGQIVKDAIDMAGGMSEEADAENINLAYELKENVMLRIKAKEVVETSKSESVPVADKSPGRTSQNTVSSGQKTGSSLSKAAVDNSIKTGETKSQSAVAVNQKKSEEPYDKTLLGMDIIKDSGGVVVAEKEEQAKGNGKVNINTALLQDLDTLPGIGPSTAQKIITYREKNGGFKKIEDLMEVSGIGESKFNSLKDYIVTE